jgi:hypothetical protein
MVPPKTTPVKTFAMVCQSILRKHIPSVILGSNPAAKDVNMTKEIKRRPRGASPRGQFEQSKNVAHALIDERRDAERRKTERLKAARLEKMDMGSSQGPSS